MSFILYYLDIFHLQITDFSEFTYLTFTSLFCLLITRTLLNTTIIILHFLIVGALLNVIIITIIFYYCFFPFFGFFFFCFLLYFFYLFEDLLIILPLYSKLPEYPTHDNFLLSLILNIFVKLVFPIFHI
jgi:hypothetical protein